MIEFLYETDFRMEEETLHEEWVQDVISFWDKRLGEVAFIFVSDDRLLDMNREFLQHDYYTDILTFDSSVGGILSGDLYISVDRVRDNADTYGVSFESELRRVMAHGLLHLMGFVDKTEAEVSEMREAENRSIKLFHVEH